MSDIVGSVLIPAVESAGGKHPMTPLVTVVMPAFNAERTISASIDSVRSQTYSNWELIVADDKSNDATQRIVEEYAAIDPRIRLLRLEVNSGVAAARNAALNSTANPVVAFLDSDDLWLPNKLGAQIDFMCTNGYPLTFTYFRRFQDGLEQESDVIKLPRSLNYEQLLRNSAIPCLTVMLDRRRCGNIMFSKIRHEDFALWLTILKSGVRAECLQEDLARYRVSPNSLSSNKIKSALWVWRVYRESEQLGLFKSSVCFFQYVLRAVLKRIS